MLLTPKGPHLFNGNSNDPDDKNRLRGAKIEEIKKDKLDPKLDGKEKIIKYSQHLDWFLARFESLVQAQDVMQSPGKWDKSLMSVGFTNGLVLAMALFLEEQSEPPYRKLPDSINKKTEEVVNGNLKAFMVDIVTQLEAIICMGEDGFPKGYSEAGEQGFAWVKWRTDTVEKINSYQFETIEIIAAIKRIEKFNEELGK